MKPGFFITGTDTGAGKTVVTSALIRYLQQGRHKVAGMKPIASGFELVDGRLQNEDIEAISAANNVDLPVQCLNRYAFEPAIAPHIAAQLANCSIDLGVLKSDVDRALPLLDALIVEGVGGWLVPLSIEPYYDIQNLAEVLELPVILVVGLKLGCINHALLTAQAISNANVPFAGWVANHIDPCYLYSDESLATLEQKMPVPKLFDVEYLPEKAQFAEVSQVSSVWDRLMTSI